MTTPATEAESKNERPVSRFLGLAAAATVYRTDGVNAWQQSLEMSRDCEQYLLRPITDLVQMEGRERRFSERVQQLLRFRDPAAPTEEFDRNSDTVMEAHKRVWNEVRVHPSSGELRILASVLREVGGCITADVAIEIVNRYFDSRLARGWADPVLTLLEAGVLQNEVRGMFFQDPSRRRYPIHKNLDRRIRVPRTKQRRNQRGRQNPIRRRRGVVPSLGQVRFPRTKHVPGPVDREVLLRRLRNLSHLQNKLGVPVCPHTRGALESLPPSRLQAARLGKSAQASEARELGAGQEEDNAAMLKLWAESRVADGVVTKALTGVMGPLETQDFDAVIDLIDPIKADDETEIDRGRLDAALKEIEKQRPELAAMVKKVIPPEKLQAETVSEEVMAREMEMTGSFGDRIDAALAAAWGECRLDNDEAWAMVKTAAGEQLGSRQYRWFQEDIERQVRKGEGTFDRSLLKNSLEVYGSDYRRLINWLKLPNKIHKVQVYEPEEGKAAFMAGTPEGKKKKQDVLVYAYRERRLKPTQIRSTLLPVVEQLKEVVQLLQPKPQPENQPDDSETAELDRAGLAEKLMALSDDVPPIQTLLEGDLAPEKFQGTDIPDANKIRRIRTNHPQAERVSMEVRAAAFRTRKLHDSEVRGVVEEVEVASRRLLHNELTLLLSSVRCLQMESYGLILRLSQIFPEDCYPTRDQLRKSEVMKAKLEPGLSVEAHSIDTDLHALINSVYADAVRLRIVQPRKQNTSVEELEPDLMQVLQIALLKCGIELATVSPRHGGGWDIKWSGC